MFVFFLFLLYACTMPANGGWDLQCAISKHTSYNRQYAGTLTDLLVAIYNKYIWSFIGHFLLN